MNKNIRGFNLIFILMLIGLMVMVWTGSSMQGQESYTKGKLIQDLEEGTVNGVIIQQNKETPTGSAVIKKTDGQSSVLNVTDVEDLIGTLEEYGIDPVIRDVPQESWFVKYLLPMQRAPP